MDMLSNILDELSGNPPAYQPATGNSVDIDQEDGQRWNSSTKWNPTGSSSQEGKAGEFPFFDVGEDGQGRNSSTERNPTGSSSKEGKAGDFPFFDVGEDGQSRNSSTDRNPTVGSNSQERKSGEFFDVGGESAADSRPSREEFEYPSSMSTWESHSKNIQGEFSKASDPGHTFKISKHTDLDSFPPREGWLNLDDLYLHTSPSQFPPPSRPAPLRETASSLSTSGQEYTEGEQQGEANAGDLERFLTKVTISRRLSFELVEEDVYDDPPETAEAMRQTKQPEKDLIDISTLGLGSNVTGDKCASELQEKAEKKVGKVAKAIEEDLAVLFGGSSVPTSSKITTADRKGKGVVGSGSSGARQPSAAVATMKERDLKQQREKEEIEKAADELGANFKKWSAGKEGNLRALLSSLQNILGPEFGWQPIPMTDLLDSASVKRQYRRATLLVHPDKLQQKGATPRQKYIAERVFGLLKDASTKFNSEELF